MDGPQARRRRRRQRRWCGSIPPTPQVRSTLPLCTHTALPTIHYNTTTQWRTTAATAPPPPATAVRCADSQSLDGSTSCRWPNFPMNDASKKKNEECCRLPPHSHRRSGRRLATYVLCTAPPSLAAAAVTPYLLYHDDGWMDERSM